MGAWISDLMARSTASGWALCALVVAGLFQQWRIITLQRPKMRELDMAEDGAEHARDAASLDALNKRITDLEARVDTASAAAHSAEMKLVYAVSAVQLLAARIRADNPNDPTLLQAMELLSAATSGGLPGWAGKVAVGMSQIKGRDE